MRPSPDMNPKGAVAMRALPQLSARSARGVALAMLCASTLIAVPAMAQPAPGAPPLPPAGAPGGPEGQPPMRDHALHSLPPALISVTGTGRASVAPDLAVVTVGVTIQARTAGEAMSQNAVRQQEVIEAIRQHGIEPRDIQTANLSLSPVQDYSQQGKPPVITGYQAGNMVTIRVRDLPQLGPVLDALVTAGANEVQGVSFQRDDAAATEADARRNAVENARARAEVIAQAAGQRLGRLVALGDTQGQPGIPRPMMMRADMAAGEAAKTPVETGELEMSADVTATWEMMPLGAAGEMPAPKFTPDVTPTSTEASPPDAPATPVPAAGAPVGDTPTAPASDTPAN